MMSYEAQLRPNVTFVPSSLLSQSAKCFPFFSRLCLPVNFQHLPAASLALISRSFRSSKRKNKLSTFGKKKRCFPPAGEWVINQSRIYCDCGCLILLEVWSCTRILSLGSAWHSAAEQRCSAASETHSVNFHWLCRVASTGWTITCIPSGEPRKVHLNSGDFHCGVRSVWLSERENPSWRRQMFTDHSTLFHFPLPTSRNAVFPIQSKTSQDWWKCAFTSAVSWGSCIHQIKTEKADSCGDKWTR